jgi:hypothetical protein
VAQRTVCRLDARRNLVRRLISRRLPLALTAVALLALVACGGAGTDGGGGESAAAEAGGGGGGGGEGFDLCATLTLDEVSDAAGVEATEAQGVNLTQGQASCNYNSADGGAVAGHTYTTAAVGFSPSQMFEGNLEMAGAEEIDGVGDRAVLVGDDNFPILWVLKNDALYAMSVLAQNLDGDGKREATIELARKAVDRLP